MHNAFSYRNKPLNRIKTRLAESGDIISSVVNEEPPIADKEEVIGVDDHDEIPSNKDMSRALDTLKKGLYAHGFEDCGLILIEWRELCM